MTIEEYKSIGIDTKIWYVDDTKYMVCEAIKTINYLIIMFNEKSTAVSGAELGFLWAKNLYLNEIDACYAALEEIEDLKKPIKERLQELGE